MILGNPPYNAFAGVSPAEEKSLVEPYKEGLVSRWGIKKFNLDDLYVRFFRLAERRIAEKTGKGVVCYISNFSYLGDPSFVVMRQRFLAEFDALWFDCLNGDSRETGKLTPEGKPDPSVFSTEYNREGIRVGTAICLMVRKEQRSDTRHGSLPAFLGGDQAGRPAGKPQGPGFQGPISEGSAGKKQSLFFSPKGCGGPIPGMAEAGRFVRRPPNNGLMERRGRALIDIDRAALEHRMKLYYNPKIEWGQLKALGNRIDEKCRPVQC